MSGFTIVVDTSICTACRGCQTACKQWNQLDGVQTENTGSHENPHDLSANTWKIVRFAEGLKEDGKPYWHFFTEQCRHCLVPGCMAVVENNEIVQDETTGAVIFTPATKNIDYKATREGCPYDIPRKNEKTGVLEKCTLCYDRLTYGRIPACVKSCPTGAMTFGPRDKMLEKVAKRVEELKKKHPKAQAIAPDEVRVIYIVLDDPKRYWKFAAGR